ncbi:hypothetical protein ACFLQY_04850 [Verrucomicrobiota bacterium]
MDIASLIAKRQLFQLWVITPLAIILLLGFSSGAFKNYKVNALAEQEALYQIIPQIEESVEKANDVLSEFSAKNPHGIEAGDEIIALLNKIAAKEKFELSSAGITFEPADKDQRILFLEAHAQGSGNLASIIKFLDEVLNQQPLLHETDVQLRQTSQKRGNYTASFKFKRLVVTK